MNNHKSQKEISSRISNTQFEVVKTTDHWSKLKMHQRPQDIYAQILLDQSF